MNRLVITGGCGFIGVNLIDHLRKTKDDIHIVVLDNESLGKRDYLAEFDVEFIHGDIRDVDVASMAFKGADAVVHLAADTRVLDSIADPNKNFDVNVVGTFNLLNIVRKNGIPLFVNASTGGAILGDVNPPVHEAMVPEPISPYGASKLAIEGYCSAFRGSYGICVSSLRFSNVYGPRSYHKGSVVAAFYKQILAGREINVYGDGTQIRDYVFVNDICKGIRNALEMKSSGVYQLGTGIPTTINELIEIMQKVIGNDAKINVKYHGFRDGEIYTTYCNISKAIKYLQYKPTINLEDGLRITWEWFNKLYNY